LVVQQWRISSPKGSESMNCRLSWKSNRLKAHLERGQARAKEQVRAKGQVREKVQAKEKEQARVKEKEQVRVREQARAREQGKEVVQEELPARKNQN
jgi:hypothetical protein